MHAHVVGSGPNGLVAAATLADAGVPVTVYEATAHLGGGCRSRHTDQLIIDECAAFHPMLAASPAFAALSDLNISLLHAPIALSHPQRTGDAAALYSPVDGRDAVADSAATVGRDAQRFTQFFAPLVSRAEQLVDLALTPPLPQGLAHPMLGAPLALPATTVMRGFRGELAKSLFAGCAAHAFAPLHQPLTSGVGTLLAVAAMRWGWPVIAGGSGELVNALVAKLKRSGLVDFQLNTVVDSPADVGFAPGDVFLSTATLSGSSWRYGPAAFKVDFVIKGDVPWRDPYSAQAGCVHLGGRSGDIVAAERATWRGNMPQQPQHPFVLVGQQFVADPSRSADGLNPLWTYAHVPHNFAGDTRAMINRIVETIELYAPGFSARIVDAVARSPQQLQAYNPNYVGGDIAGGANSVRQLLARPRLGNPYRTADAGVYRAGASTAPGGGVHGMSGRAAALLVLVDAQINKDPRQRTNKRIYHRYNNEA